MLTPGAAHLVTNPAKLLRLIARASTRGAILYGFVAVSAAEAEVESAIVTGRPSAALDWPEDPS